MTNEHKPNSTYRGRIAPTPSGYLHAGHLRTFRIAWERAREAGGTLFYRNDDLDPRRSRPEYLQAAMVDLRAHGLDWDEGPDLGGPSAPYHQSARGNHYLKAWRQLREAGLLYPCRRSRKEIREAGWLPADGEEYLFPPEFRPAGGAVPLREFDEADEPGEVNWRFRTPDDHEVRVEDLGFGPKTFQTGKDFGDFLVWRKDGVAAYELATVADEIDMGVTEVVRGADLLKSSARQCLLFEALGKPRPAFYHCELVLGPDGRKLSKSERSLASS